MVVRLLGMWFATSIVAAPVIAQFLKHAARPMQPAYVPTRRS
jgi:hypothetical protein